MFVWFRTVFRAMRRPDARGPMIGAAGLLIIGTAFYALVENWTFVDAFYFSVTTLTTVGYGSPAPTTDVGKLFTVFFVLSGVGVFLGVINAIGQEALKDPDIGHRIRRRAEVVQNQEDRD